MAVEGISVRYQAFVEKFARLVDAVKPVVVEVAVKAFEKFLISENNKSDAANLTVNDYYRANTLLSVILNKINQNDVLFDTFVAILQDVNIAELADELKRAVDPTIEGRNTADSDSGSTAVQHSEATGFRCPCGHCSLESYFRDRSKCRGQDKGPFPYLNLSDLVEDDKTTLTHQLVHETIAIIQEFQTLADGVFEATEAPVNKIIETVFSFGQEGLPKPIQSTHGEELEKIENISQVHIFLTRHKYISFINYRILEKIINKHCEASKDQLGDYLQHFKDFCRRNVFEVPASVLRSSSPSSNQLLVVKVNDDIWFGDCPYTMNGIFDIQNKIAKVIELDRGYIRLLDVSKGCIQLSFAILSCQEASIFPLTTSQLGELISLGMIVLYQPKVQLPTNIQASDVQSHDIPTTVSETPRIQSPESECKTSHNIDNTPHISHFTKTGDPSDLESENTSHISHFTKTGDPSDLESENTSYNSPHISHFIKIGGPSDLVSKTTSHNIDNTSPISHFTKTGDPSDLESENTSHNTPPISHYTEAGVPSDLEPEELHQAYSGGSSPQDETYPYPSEETSSDCVQELLVGQGYSLPCSTSGQMVIVYPWHRLERERKGLTAENAMLTLNIRHRDVLMRERDEAYKKEVKELVEATQRELRENNEAHRKELQELQALAQLQKELRERDKKHMKELEEAHLKELIERDEAHLKELRERDEAHKKEVTELIKANQKELTQLQQVLTQPIKDEVRPQIDIENTIKSDQTQDDHRNETVDSRVPYQQRDQAAQRPIVVTDNLASWKELKNLNTIQSSDSSSDELTPLEMDLNIPSLKDMFGFNPIGD